MRKITKAVAVATTAVALAGVGVISAQAAPAATASYYLYNPATGKCAVPYGGSTANNTDVVQFTCTWGAGQLWELVSHSVGGDELTYNGACLTVYGGSRSKGANLVVFQCNDSEAQRWAGTPGAYANQNSGMYMTTYGNGGSDNAVLTQWPFIATGDDGWQAQDWGLLAA
jgi:pectate lyase